jgi:hypothetical protein
MTQTSAASLPAGQVVQTVLDHLPVRIDGIVLALPSN